MLILEINKNQNFAICISNVHQYKRLVAYINFVESSSCYCVGYACNLLASF